MSWRTRRGRSVEFRRMLLKGRRTGSSYSTPWPRRPTGKPLPRVPPGRGHLQLWFSHGPDRRVAVSKKGEVRVEHVVCAVDCGHVVNPAPLRNSWRAAWSMVSRRSSKPRSASRGRVAGQFRYLPDAPPQCHARVETHLALSGGDKWGGIGNRVSPRFSSGVQCYLYHHGQAHPFTATDNHDLVGPESQPYTPCPLPREGDTGRRQYEDL
jgi:hypothetical protein